MDDLLQQGITAYQAGKRDEARNIFIAVVKQSPDNERAWGWMYNVCNTDQERTHCLKQIVRINPIFPLEKSASNPVPTKPRQITKQIAVNMSPPQAEHSSVSQKLIDTLKQELYNALTPIYIDAAMNRMPEIAKQFGVPANSVHTRQILIDWAEKQAREVADSAIKTTINRLDGLNILRINEGLPLESEEVQRLVLQRKVTSEKLKLSEFFLAV